MAPKISTPVLDMSDFLNQPRQTDANFHLETAYYWHDLGRSQLLHMPLVYSAFEYRCGVERTLFELYALMKGLKLVPEEVNRIKDMGDLVKRLFQLWGGNKEAELAITFNEIYASEQMGVAVSKPDIGRLKRLWAQLSQYCHAQRYPDKTWNDDSWVKRGYDTLDATLKYIKEIMLDKKFGFMDFPTMPPEAYDLSRDFISGSLDEASLRVRLKLMKPIIEIRGRR